MAETIDLFGNCGAVAAESVVVDLDELDLPEVALNGAEHLTDPHGTWQRVQEGHWLARSELGVNVLPHRANWELLRDRRLHAMGDTPLAIQGITKGVLHTYWTQGLLVSIDGEPHNRLRRLQNKVFTPNMVDRMRPAMREVAANLAERFAGEGACDFVAEFSTRYPVEIIPPIMTADFVVNQDAGSPTERCPHPALPPRPAIASCASGHALGSLLERGFAAAIVGDMLGFHCSGDGVENAATAVTIPR
jgi:hypothetical protein